MTGATSAGRAFVFGDDIDTDVLAPGLYMKGPIEDLAEHCLEAVDPTFAGAVREGDVIAGGRNFGIGSSREQAVQALRHLGIRALVAKSFAGIFYRNVLNFGLAAVTCAEADRIEPGDRIRVDAAAGTVENLTRGETYACDALPPRLLAMIADGGLVNHLEKQLAAGKGDQ
jgi:3-isopropylmalate/(R)-2-methylmalate dehydratase small subunit